MRYAYKRVLECITSEDPEREGLRDTPGRVAHMMKHELLSGYEVDPTQYLDTQFMEGVDGLVLVGPIPLYSLCEHHMIPFIGKAWVGYIPANGVVTGLSKIARMVNGYMRRLQVQERLTEQIVNAITSKLAPTGAGCLTRCEHLCMTMRGVQAAGTLTSVSVFQGALLEKPAARAEFLSMVDQTL